MNARTVPVEEADHQEVREWIEAFELLLEEQGPSQAAQLLDALTRRAQQAGVNMPVQLNTPYVNTIPPQD